jgi:hypothetical protein
MAVLVLLPALAKKTEAVPLLQLDMAGGVYDPITETIVAPNGTFTVFAILTPQNNATSAEIAALLNTNFYVSVALTPQLQQTTPAPNLGSFSFGAQGGTQTTVNAATGMTYGVPPLEIMATTQGFDPGDLSKHGIYPTYFSEFKFNFSAAQQSGVYNTANTPGGPQAGTGAYYFAFTGNSSLLNPGYQLHFDLYNESLQNCATKKNPAACLDVDVNSFAPFSHDAETIPRKQVPEPTAALGLLTGLAVAVRKLTIA